MIWLSLAVCWNWKTNNNRIINSTRTTRITRGNRLELFSYCLVKHCIQIMFNFCCFSCAQHFCIILAPNNKLVILMIIFIRFSELMKNSCKYLQNSGIENKMSKTKKNVEWISDKQPVIARMFENILTLTSLWIICVRNALITIACIQWSNYKHFLMFIASIFRIDRVQTESHFHITFIVANWHFCPH